MNMPVILQNRAVKMLQEAMATADDDDDHNSDNAKEAKVDKAIALFQKALSLILQTTEVHMLEGGLRYDLDEQGLISLANDVARTLQGKIRPIDMGINLVGPENTYIYWKALNIGDGDDHENLALLHEEIAEIEYEHLGCAMYHSMICLFNLAICFQYKGVRVRSPLLLQDAIDHYMQAYELLTRFSNEDRTYYRLCLAIMNNLATLYAFLGDIKRRNICHQYLLSTLILLTEDGDHLMRISSTTPDNPTAPSSSSNHVDQKGTSERQDDRDLYEKFLENVMHLILVENAVAPAA